MRTGRHRDTVDVGHRDVERYCHRHRHAEAITFTHLVGEPGGDPGHQRLADSLPVADGGDVAVAQRQSEAIELALS